MNQTKRIFLGPPSRFEFIGGIPCLDFANTVDERASARPHELLTNYERLLQWGTEAAVITSPTAERLRQLASEAPGNALTTLRHAIRLRETLYDVFSLVARRRAIPTTALVTLSEAVRHAARHAQLVYANRRITAAWVEPERQLDSMLWPVSRSAAELLVGEDLSHVRKCASESCSWLFLDKTKNHRRRWCDMKICGNRHKARRYYKRKKAG